MSKLLTIAIPTFNRAGKLERQLVWLSRSLEGVESLCDVVISDNASTDDTPAVCAKLVADLSKRGVSVRINRNDQNVGPLPNIARCIELARSRFCWVIGDDDEIPDDKLVWIVARLEAEPDLASVVLNFGGVGTSIYERCYHHATDLRGPGELVIGKCLEQAYFGLAFMTAQIYRTEFAQAAIRAWPDGMTNYDYQVFVTAFTGKQGKVLATAEPHCTYVTGDNIYERNKRVGLILYADSVEVFLQLAAIGFDRALCRRVAWRHLWQFKQRFLRNALRCNPVLTLATVARIGSYLAHLELDWLTSVRQPAPKPADTRLDDLSATPVVR